MEVPDFGGYATKNDLLCSDGRTIKAGAFAHQDGQRVPLVWHHNISGPQNVLGHAILENRADGVYARAFFNDTESGKTAKAIVLHGDVNGLSIRANKLVERGSHVVHGLIQELSIVISRANPGATIDQTSLAHADGSLVEDDEAIIHTGEQELEYGSVPEAIAKIGAIDNPQEETSEEEEAEKESGETVTEQTLEHADGRTVKDVYDDMTEEQQGVVDFIVASAVEDALAGKGGDAEHSDTSTDEIVHAYQEGFTMGRNVFKGDGTGTIEEGPTLTHEQLAEIVGDAPRLGSLKESFLLHAAEYGIEDINLLFPDAKGDGQGISWIKRRTEWVANVLGGVRRSPFSRVKSLSADITAEEARAKGYVKGNLKKDEIIKMLKRVTTPKTIYKKQKLDRDDIVDITEIDIVTWLKGEMRLMLEEEIARAILVGDGREPDDEDKIDEDHLRPIAFDIDMYNTVVELDSTPTVSEEIDEVVRARKHYKGTGTPSFYTTDDVLTDMILEKDTLGRRLYATEAELAAALRVKEIVPVEVMESYTDIFGILVNLTDYQVGADKGGEINTFDDFDIDYNQQKYLIETRISGALIKPKAAVTIKYNQGTVVTPNAPTFVSGTGVVTIPSQTGVVYKNKDTGATLTAGAQSALAAGASIEVVAEPASGYSFPHGFDADWEFTRPSA